MITAVRLAAASLLTGVAVAASAAAQAAPPTLPGPPPWIPEVPGLPYQGTGSYLYNYIEVPPPATVDARGVNIGTNAELGRQLQGLPGSKLGNSPHHPDELTSANALYGIDAGMALAPTVSPGPAVSAGLAGRGLESPSGVPTPASPADSVSTPLLAGN